MSDNGQPDPTLEQASAVVLNVSASLGLAADALRDFKDAAGLSGKDAAEVRDTARDEFWAASDEVLDGAKQLTALRGRLDDDYAAG